MILKSYLLKKRSRFNRYFTSLLLLLISFGALFAFERMLDGQIFSLVMAASLLSALHGGLGPAIMVSALGSIGLDIYFIDDTEKLFHPLVTFIRVFLYFAISMLVVSLTGFMRKYFQEAEENRRQAEVLSKEKDALMAIVAHDLKNPLNVILGCNEMLQAEMEQEKSGKNISQILEMVAKNCESSLTLIQQLQDYSQLGHPDYRPRLSAFSLFSLVKKVSASSAVLAQKKSIQLNVVCDSEEVFIKGDEGLVARAIQNLVDNAIKYSPLGSKVDILCSHDQKESRVEVKDEGPGILPEEVKQLFQPFFKTSNQPTAGETSTGLGLAMVKSVAQMHRGEIKVESFPQKGCKFILTLPLAG